jgi:hypothetical protein
MVVPPASQALVCHGFIRPYWILLEMRDNARGLLADLKDLALLIKPT